MNFFWAPLSQSSNISQPDASSSRHIVLLSQTTKLALVYRVKEKKNRAIYTHL